MKKIFLLLSLAIVAYSCKKKETQIQQTSVPTNTVCTTCPYCVADTVLADTLVHMTATIDDTISFVATALIDTVVSSTSGTYVDVIGVNTINPQNPEIKIHRRILDNTVIGDTTNTTYITYKVNNVTYQSRKGIFISQEYQAWYVLSVLTLQKFGATFCFNTDTIAGVSHKITLGSVKVKN